MKKLLALCGVAALTLGACKPAGTGSTDPIKLGFIGPLTGDAAPYGIDTLNGLKMKVQEVNDAGGIDGRMVEIIAEDGRCTGGDAASAAQKLTSIDKVVAIVGGQCSGETLAAAPIAQAAMIPMVSPISSSPDVTDAGSFIYRDYPSDALKTKAMATYFQENGLAKVAIISENTDFATGFRDSLVSDVGADAFVFNETVAPDTKDFRTLMTRLKSVDFDIFVANGQTPVAIGAMLQQMHEQGITKPVISHDVADSLQLVEIAGEDAEDIWVISVRDAGKGKDFETRFIADFGLPSQTIGFVAHAYDAAGVLLQAIDEVGTDGDAIRMYLDDLSSYPGMVGTFHFDENGDVVGVPYVLKQVQDGIFTDVKDLPLN